jgi:hypothetical protein
MDDNQHIVPQSLLKNFRFCEKKGKFYVYTIIKQKNDGPKTMLLNIEQICSKNNYFKTPIINYDKSFKSVEQDIPSIITRLLDNGVNSLNSEDKRTLLEFIFFQYIRSKAARKVAEYHSNLIKEEHNQTGKKTLNVNSNFIKSPDFVKHLHGAILTDNKDILIFLESLKIELKEKKETEPEFVIGDSPVLFDLTGEGVYFPISPIKCLWLHIETSQTPLESKFINQLQFLTAVDHVIASNKDTLTHMINSPLALNDLEKIDNSYWKSILKTQDFEKSVLENKHKIHSALRQLTDNLDLKG